MGWRKGVSVGSIRCRRRVTRRLARAVLVLTSVPGDVNHFEGVSDEQGMSFEHVDCACNRRRVRACGGSERGRQGAVSEPCCGISRWACAFRNDGYWRNGSTWQTDLAVTWNDELQSRLRRQRELQHHGAVP